MGLQQRYVLPKSSLLLEELQRTLTGNGLDDLGLQSIVGCNDGESHLLSLVTCTEVDGEVVRYGRRSLTLGVEVGLLVAVHQVGNGELRIGLVGRYVVGSVLIGSLEIQFLKALAERTNRGHKILGFVDKLLHIRLCEVVDVFNLGDIPL